MKNTLVILTLLLVICLSAFAVAGDLVFTDMATITNTGHKGAGIVSTFHACEISNRVGDSEIVATLQGSILSSGSAFANMGSAWTISNATDTAVNPSSLQKQVDGTAALNYRLHIVSGADIGNTLSGTCKAVK